MGSFSAMHWLVVLAVAVLFCGGGRVTRFMGDLAGGVKAFKSGMRDQALEDAAKK